MLEYSGEQQEVVCPTQTDDWQLVVKSRSANTPFLHISFFLFKGVLFLKN